MGKKKDRMKPQILPHEVLLQPATRRSSSRMRFRATLKILRSIPRDFNFIINVEKIQLFMKYGVNNKIID